MTNLQRRMDHRRSRRHRLLLLIEQQHGAYRVAGLQLQAFGGEAVDNQAVAHLPGLGGGDAAVFQATVVDQPHRGLLVGCADGQQQRLAVAHGA